MDKQAASSTALVLYQPVAAKRYSAFYTYINVRLRLIVRLLVLFCGFAFAGAFYCHISSSFFLSSDFLDAAVSYSGLAYVLLFAVIIFICSITIISRPVVVTVFAFFSFAVGYNAFSTVQCFELSLVYFKTVAHLSAAVFSAILFCTEAILFYENAKFGLNGVFKIKRLFAYLFKLLFLGFAYYYFMTGG